MHQSDKREYLLPTVRAATQADNEYIRFTERMQLSQMSVHRVLMHKHDDWKARRVGASK